MYLYAIHGGIRVYHSDILYYPGSGAEYVHIRLEGDNDSYAETNIPVIYFNKVYGFNEVQLAHFRTYLKNNLHLLFKYAACGGVENA